MPEQPKTIGLVVKRQRAEAAELAGTVAKQLRRRGITVLVEREMAALGDVQVVAKSEMVRVADLIVVLGGGSMERAGRGAQLFTAGLADCVLMTGAGNVIRSPNA